MKFGTGSTTELTQKCEGQSTKMPYVRPNITSGVLEHKWRASLIVRQHEIKYCFYVLA